MKFGYHLFSKKSYYKALKDSYEFNESISIGYYSLSEGGTTGEFSLDFYLVEGKWIIDSKVYTDGYNAFFEFLNILEGLDLNSNINPEFIIDKLDKYNAINFS